MTVCVQMADFDGLKIPPQSREPFAAVAKLSEDEATALAEALEVPDCLPTGPELITRVQERVPGLVPMVSRLVYSTLALISSLAQDVDDAGELAVALSKDPAIDGLNDVQRAQLAKRLEGLMQSPSLRLTAKAVDIRTEYEHVFADARILTDIRPVFSDRNADTPAAGVVVDTLKLDYYGTDGNRRSFYVALDEEDLVSIKEQATRALAKSKGMRGVLESANLVTWKDEWNAAD
jgi:hypothetical protein